MSGEGRQESGTPARVLAVSSLVRDAKTDIQSTFRVNNLAVNL